MLRVRNLWREARVNRQTDDERSNRIVVHGHESNINRVRANEYTDVSENSPSPSSEEVNDSQVVNILSNKRAESRKYRKDDLIAIKRTLHGPGQNVIWTVRDVKSVEKRSLCCVKI
ncbi:hypothetical protein K0M31_001361 [Melipona bicolor]|uniref:Uncharacterized protein n=1 Tax=Melipona bicolor TaxID=60889 RepID=A0AA40GGI9_9HYME|nr:hypothetical protein K0M31_001361 [Melipona bicolor]